jgi:RES domain-containing protein
MSVDLDGLDIETLDALPADPALFGDRWLEEGRTPVLRTPSVIIPEAANLLINPRHPAGPGRIQSVRDFSFDPRLWLLPR